MSCSLTFIQNCFTEGILILKTLTISFEDALLWKDAFEKAKKIVGTECEIYSGKSNPDDYNPESESDSCSEVSYGEESDDEECKLTKSTKESADICNQEASGEHESKETHKDNEVATKNTEDVIVGLEKLTVKNNCNN